MVNKAEEGFLQTTNFNKSANDADLLDPQKRKPEGKAAIQPGGVDSKKQENKATKRYQVQREAFPSHRRQYVRDRKALTL